MENVVKWVNKDKTEFVISDPEEFARLWGEEKSKKCAKKNLSRCLNYQITIGRLKRNCKRRFRYIFVNKESREKCQNISMLKENRDRSCILNNKRSGNKNFLERPTSLLHGNLSNRFDRKLSKNSYNIIDIEPTSINETKQSQVGFIENDLGINQLEKSVISNQIPVITNMPSIDRETSSDCSESSISDIFSPDMLEDQTLSSPSDKSDDSNDQDVTKANEHEYNALITDLAEIDPKNASFLHSFIGHSLREELNLYHL